MADVTEVEDEVAEAQVPLPRWPWIAGSVLSLVGLGITGYLTYEHYTGSTSLACPSGGSGVVNCLKVTTTIYNHIHGVPVVILGLVFFVVMLALQSPWAWGVNRWWMKAARIVWCLVGIATALKLVYDELYRLHAICEWCTSVHVITLIIFVVTIFGTLSVSSSGYEGDEEAPA